MLYFVIIFDGTPLRVNCYSARLLSARLPDGQEVEARCGINYK